MIKIIVALLLLLLVGAAAAIYILVDSPVGDAGAVYEIKVERSDDAGMVGAKLITAGADLRPTVYKALMILTGVDKQIHPGVYHIPGELSHYGLVRWFEEGRVETRKVTVPEGLALWEVVPILSRGLPSDSGQLAELLRDSSFLADCGIKGRSFEGYLFPETYTFFAGEEPRQVIRRMVELFFSVFDESHRRRAEELGLSVNEVVTLASLIEAEAADGAERKLISSVFHNRLKRGMRLQCDPTVIYALGGLERPLQLSDLDYESPYNTYINYGLPPGPICSPGRAALEAALYPEESGYLYFVADGAGKHLFSETLEAHNRARREIRRSQGRHD